MRCARGIIKIRFLIIVFLVLIKCEIDAIMLFKFRHFPYLFSLEEVVMEDTTMCTFVMLKEYEPGIHL